MTHLLRMFVLRQLVRDPWGALRGCNCVPKPHRRNDPKWRAISAVQAKMMRKLEASDFAIVKRVGRGDVGNVQLVRLKGTNVLFAMKVLEKQEMVDRNKMHRVRAEDEILSSVDHPMLATLFSSFQTKSSLYFLMDYCPGGELFELLQKQPGKRFPETAARFYTAEILLALQYLHLLGYVYRDLKVGEMRVCVVH
jgi:serine/threonine protein kinase